MQKQLIWGVLGACLCGAAVAGDYPYRAAALTDVKVTGGFWLPRLETNRLVTVKTDFRKCEETGRIANFEKAGRREKGGFKGVPWDDSDVYKVIEGAANTLAQHPDAELDKYLDDLIAKIAKAQEDDGYLYTARTLGHKSGMMGKRRFSNTRDACELYNVGHLYEAAVAHYEVTGKRTLLEVAIKNADLVEKVFGPRAGQNPDVPGHEEIEVGLCRLYRATGNEKYLRLARHFVDRRGRQEFRPLWGSAYQDHAPVLEQCEALGHAVRAAYLYMGMADVATLADDSTYSGAIDSLWWNVVGKKLHLNGGIGARQHITYRDPKLGKAMEAFGDEYDLPNDGAYLETCAAIGNVLWNERMFMMHGDAKYVDVLERTLYNGFLSGISIGGDEFFYPNPLASKGGYARSKWFGCSCCPVNIVRFIPQVGSFAYATRGDEAFVNLFLESEATLKLRSGTVKLSQRTDYPWDGKVTIKVGSRLVAADNGSGNDTVGSRVPRDRAERFTLNLRVPGWCTGRPVPSNLYTQTVPGTLADYAVKVNGKAVTFTPEKGYCAITREWKQGDVVEIAMNMSVRRIQAHPAVVQDRGRLAVERGPLVYCAEGVDNGGKAFEAVLPGDVAFAAKPIVIAATSMTALVGGGLTLVPYFAWNHRGAGELQTWFATSEDVGMKPVRGALVKASYCFFSDSVEAVWDGLLPASSHDLKPPRLTFWKHFGTEEWVQVKMPAAQTFSGVDVYWFDDFTFNKGGCALPESWSVQVRANAQAPWVDVEGATYQTKLDGFSPARFAKPVTAQEFRVKLRCRPKCAAGIVEIQLKQ